jgi:sugar-specific transcriptional regulator TrmB
VQDKENNIKTLVDFGISRTQAKIFLALAEKGTLTIRAAAETSGVGRPDTYRAMLELKNAGLIETVLDNPTKYRAIGISDAISILMAKKHKEIMSLKENSNRLLQQFQIKKENNNIDVNSEFVIVPKGTSSFKKRIKALRNAEISVDCITSFKRFNQTLLIASDDIIDAANRGVRIRFILDKINMNKPLSEEFTLFCRNSSCEIKYVSEPPDGVVTIFDKQEVQIATSEEGDFAQIPMLWSNNSVLVKICQHYFDKCWMGQSEIQGILEEIKLS